MTMQATRTIKQVHTYKSQDIAWFAETYEAITDGNLVTAPAWPAHPAWIAQFLKVLGTRIEL